MKLYEINKEIEQLTDSMEWDAEANAWIDVSTGEIVSDEEYQQRLDKLGMDKKEILSWMSKTVLNDRAEMAALKDEEKRLAANRKARERRVERFLRILDRECAGTPQDLGFAKISYRKSEALEIVQGAEADVIAWLEEHEHDDCLKYAEPEIRKDPLKKLIKNGEYVPFAVVMSRNNMSLK